MDDDIKKSSLFAAIHQHELVKAEERKRRQEHLESQKAFASLMYRTQGASSFANMRDLPGGKDDRPAERLVRGKVRGKNRKIGPCV